MRLLRRDRLPSSLRRTENAPNPLESFDFGGISLDPEKRNQLLARKANASMLARYEEASPLDLSRDRDKRATELHKEKALRSVFKAPRDSVDKMLPRIDPVMKLPLRNKQFFCFIEKKSLENRLENRYKDDEAEGENITQNKPEKRLRK